MADPIELTRGDTPPLSITVDDAEPVIVRFSEVKHSQAAALRQQSHGAWRITTLFEAANESIGPEELAGLLFLGRRQAGDDISYDAVAQQLDEADTVKLEFLTDDDAEADDPEA